MVQDVTLTTGIIPFVRTFFGFELLSNSWSIVIQTVLRACERMEVLRWSRRQFWISPFDMRCILVLMGKVMKEGSQESTKRPALTPFLGYVLKLSHWWKSAFPLKLTYITCREWLIEVAQSVWGETPRKMAKVCNWNKDYFSSSVFVISDWLILLLWIAFRLLGRPASSF